MNDTNIIIPTNGGSHRPYAPRPRQVVPQQMKGMSASRKGKALLIALANLNIIFFVCAFKVVDIQVATQMITAILFLVGIYVGVQGGVDMVSEYRSNNSNSKNYDEKVTKNYDYKMEYADKK